MRTFTLMITVSAALMASLTVASADESCKAEATDEARGAALNSLMTECEKEANGRGTSMGSKR